MKRTDLSPSFKSRRSTVLVLALLASAATGARLFSQTPQDALGNPDGRESEEPPRVALVLAGGSAYGIAHIGAIRVLEELGISADLVVGTSMGAVVGGFYALGMDAAGLEEVTRGTSWNELLSDSGPTDPGSWSEMRDRSRYVASVGFDRRGFRAQGGVISGNRIVRYLDMKMLDASLTEDFDAFPRRFRAVATDVATGKREAFAKGSLPDAIRASMSLPGIFSPWKVGSSWYVDGGTVDNLPIDVARELGARYVIAVDLFDGTAFDSESLERTPLPALTRSFDYLLGATSRPQYPNADLVIRVDLAGMSRADFEKSGEFIAIGEKAARAMEGELTALAARIEAEAPRSGEDYPQRKELRRQETLSGVIVEGGSEEDRRFVEKAAQTAAKAAEKREGREAYLEELTKRLDRSGRFDGVRYSLVPGPGNEGALLVRVEGRKEDDNRLRLAFEYQASIGGAIVGNLNVVPSLRLSGITTPDSRLEADIEIVDSPGADIRFVQPLGYAFSVIPFYRYSHDFETRLTETSIGYQYQTTLSSTGINLVLEALPGTAFSGGISCDWLTTVDLPGVTGGTASGRTAMVSAGIEVNTLDFPAFPMNGALARLDFRSSLPVESGDVEFRTLTTEGNLFLSLDTPFTLALLWKGGTDFSAGPAPSSKAPAYYQPDLANRRLFPGPLKAPERIGSHVAGFGLEAKHNLNWKDRGITVPVFLIVHGALGAVLEDPFETEIDPGEFHGNVACGMGVRFTEAFAAEARFGVHRTREGDYQSFLALDIGAFSY